MCVYFTSIYLFLLFFKVVLPKSDYLYHPGFTHPDSPYNYAPVRPIKSIHAVAMLHSDYGLTGKINFDQNYYEGAPVYMYGEVHGLRGPPDYVLSPDPPSMKPPPSFHWLVSRSKRSPPQEQNSQRLKFLDEFNPQAQGPLRVHPSYDRNTYDPRPNLPRVASDVPNVQGAKQRVDLIDLAEVEQEDLPPLNPLKSILTFKKSSHDENSEAVKLSEKQTKLEPPPMQSEVSYQVNPSFLHAIHIHQYGDLRNSCLSTGEHFNPDWSPHGGPNDWVRHVGDLGNIFSTGKFRIEDSHISLFGRNNIIGRSVVIHQLSDDYGRSGSPSSQKTGNAGEKIACGVIAKKDVVYHQPGS